MLGKETSQPPMVLISRQGYKMPWVLGEFYSVGNKALQACIPRACSSLLTAGEGFGWWVDGVGGTMTQSCKMNVCSLMKS